jgi:hypothetical protein
MSHEAVDETVQNDEAVVEQTKEFRGLKATTATIWRFVIISDGKMPWCGRSGHTPALLVVSNHTNVNLLFHTCSETKCENQALRH